MISTYNFCNTQVLNPSINGIYVCDDCGSKSIIEAEDGFVCTDCGLTIEQPVLKYNKPYQNDLRNRVQTKVIFDFCTNLYNFSILFFKFYF